MNSQWQRLSFLPAVFAALTCAFVFAPHTARAQQTSPPPAGRVKGPIVGPEIKLPRGSYETPAAEVQAQGESAARLSVPVKWEYCSIVYISSRRKDYSPTVTYFAYVRYFRGGSETIDGANEEEALANALTKLGDEGWELVAIREQFGVSEGTGSSTSSYFFKRPR